MKVILYRNELAGISGTGKEFGVQDHRFDMEKRFPKKRERDTGNRRGGKQPRSKKTRFPKKRVGVEKKSRFGGKKQC